MTSLRAKPSRWNVGPGLVDPRWRSSWRDLVVALPLWPEGSRARDVAGGHDGTLQELAAYGFGPSGSAVVVTDDGADRIFIPHDTSLDVGAGDFSALVQFVTNTAPASAERVIAGTYVSGGTVTPNWVFGHWSGAGGMRFRIRDSGGNEAFVGASLATGVLHTVLGVRRGSTLELWRSGALLGTDDASGVGDIDNTVGINIGRAFTTDPINGPISLFMLWHRPLEPSEAGAITLDPFGPFRMARRTLVRVPAAGGGDTVPVPVAMHHYRQMMGG